jgi:pyruvate dehydrogenase E2 component (dihydrolipoamide acetyltransferase)
MATTVIMPKVDMDQETGTVVEWLKLEGDAVEKGEPILVIETDKVAIDVESPASGILQGIQAKPEEVIPIGTVIAYILEPGEELPEEVVAQKVQTPSLPQAVTIPTAAVDFNVTPVARNIAATHNIDLTKIEGTGLRGKVTKRDVQTQLNTLSSYNRSAGKVCATPAARRTAREKEVDLKTVFGSGPGGRIQAADVLAVPVAVPEARTASEMKVIPLQGMRRTIAERMTQSYQTTPHINFTVRVDMSRFEETRDRLNTKVEATNQSKVSLTALLVKVVAWALKLHPLLNSTLKDDGIHLLPDVNLGIAVALLDGLIVPVVHRADKKSIKEVANEVNELVTRARHGQLTPTDVASGTFTISNLGPFGIEHFTAIINPHQAAILAIGTVQQEVAVDEKDQIVLRPMMRMTLSVDHRIVDGAVAAHFLNDLREAMESPDLLLW